MSYQWLILQDGSLPLAPDGHVERRDHVCTSTLIWPVGTKPTRASSVLVDPCFSRSGRKEAERRLAELDADFGCIGYYFETHQHYDHVLCLPGGESTFDELPAGAGNEYSWVRLNQARVDALPGVNLVNCPGHDPQLQAVRFDAADGETWIVGDAILDSQWLKAWMFYWPNRYEGPEIVETWRSVGAILAAASVVIPGHGPPIPVDAGLLEGLLAQFPRAFLSDRCPEVADVLRNRLQLIRSGPAADWCEFV